MAEVPWRAAAPVPPPPSSGNTSLGRPKSEIGARSEPPLCVQNAMMTKDKKPFTYTPGGIDLSEIKSPRMARRIERNANAPGAGDAAPKSPPGGHVTGPLPPSALSAMQSALPVQVFPIGVPPPPPPPPTNAPPPPPPMQPLPTKPVATNEGVFERPDMTRIIPENPMAMLRKTPRGDRKSFLDELNDATARPHNNVQYTQPAINVQQPSQYAPQSQYTNNNVQHIAPQPPQFSPHPQQFSPQPQQFSPQPQQYSAQPQQFSPQPQQFSPQPQQFSPQPQHYSPQPQQYSPQPQKPPANQQFNQQNNSAQPQTQQFNQQPQHNAHPAPFYQNSSNNTPQMVAYPKQDSPPSHMKTSSANIGSLYIPPINQAKSADTPPTPPQRSTSQSPQSPLPKLNSAPRPWQNQKKEPELPPWAQRQQQQQQQPPSPPIRNEDQIGARISVQPPMVTPVQMQPPPSRPGLDVVFVTQPEVYQHPGPGPNQNWVPPQRIQSQPKPQPQPQQNKVAAGTRIIPIQIEGSTANQNQANRPSTPGTANSDRNFNRQQSWPANPTQSNSFKVIQKITNTEGNDDEDDDQQGYVQEYGPRTSQHFPADQMRKMNLNDSDRDMMNRVKQVPQAKPNQPQVRTIPVHIEGNDTPQPYVHPSEQKVPEPKKYTGSAIPSRAFKMVQAMTANTLGPDQSDL